MNVVSQSQLPEKEVISASQTKIVLFMVLSFLAALGITLFINGNLNSGDNLDFILSWGAILFFGACGLLYIGFLLTKTPRIILNREGISFVSLFKHQFWKWRDVGPFVSDVQIIQTSSRHYVCAFTDENHDLMQAHKQSEQPTYKTADIIIGLSLLPPGKNGDTATQFANRLNEWRDEFGAPEIEIKPHMTKKVLLTLRKKMRNQRILIFAMIFVAFIILLLLLEDPSYAFRLLRLR